MNYCELKLNDVANGPGVRVSLFVSGCTHHCKGCFNEESWDFNAGKEFTQETVDTIIEALKPPYVTGLTLLGGEPFERVNQQGLLPLLRKMKKVCPTKDVWCFTGYLFDEDILGRMCKEWEETAEQYKHTVNELHPEKLDVPVYIRTSILDDGIKTGFAMFDNPEGKLSYFSFIFCDDQMEEVFIDMVNNMEYVK